MKLVNLYISMLSKIWVTLEPLYCMVMWTHPNIEITWYMHNEPSHLHRFEGSKLLKTTNGCIWLQGLHAIIRLSKLALIFQRWVAPFLTNHMSTCKHIHTTLMTWSFWRFAPSDGNVGPLFEHYGSRDLFVHRGLWRPVLGECRGQVARYFRVILRYNHVMGES